MVGWAISLDTKIDMRRRKNNALSLIYGQGGCLAREPRSITLDRAEYSEHCALLQSVRRVDAFLIEGHDHEKQRTSRGVYEGER